MQQPSSLSLENIWRIFCFFITLHAENKKANENSIIKTANGKIIFEEAITVNGNR